MTPAPGPIGTRPRWRRTTCAWLAAALSFWPAVWPDPTRAATAEAAQAVECPPEPDTSAAARAAPRDRGFLWRLTRDGRVSWLYGTLHVGRAEWAAPGPRLREALRSVDAVALELDPLDPQVAGDFARALDALPPAESTLDAGHRQRLERLAQRACTTLQPDTHPLVQLMQLTLAEARRERLDPRYAQEIVLSMAARALQRPVHSLETAAQQVSALLPPRTEQWRDEVDRALKQLEEGRSQPVLRRLAEVWEQGDYEALQDYPRWCECLLDDADRASFARLNDARNDVLAERIAALHDGRRLRVFAAVGALHMTGPRALPKLLAERHGYTVERVVLTR